MNRIASIVISTVLVLTSHAASASLIFDFTVSGGGNFGTVSGCSGQLIPDSILRFSSAATGEMPSLNV